MTTKLAQIVNPALSTPLQDLSKNPDGGSQFLERLVPALIGYAFVIAVLLFTFTFLIGAIRYMTSAGDKANTEAARGTLTNALVGLVITFSIYAIMRLIETFFGIDIIQLNIANLKIA